MKKQKKQNAFPKILNPSLAALLLLFSSMLDSRLLAIVSLTLIVGLTWYLLAIKHDTKTLLRYGKAILIAFIVASVVIAVMRALSGPEDSWLCRGGQWVRHGNPSTAPPSRPCQ